MYVRLIFATAKTFDHVYGGNDLRQFGNLFPLLRITFRLVALQEVFLRLELLILLSEFRDIIGQVQKFLAHQFLVPFDSHALFLVLISPVLLVFDQLVSASSEYIVSVANLNNLVVVAITSTAHFLQKGLILLDCNLLLLNSLLFALEDVKLLFLPLDFLLAHFVLFFEFGDVLVASAHDFCIVIQEGGVLDQRLLQLVVLFSELRLSALELELLLGKVLLLGQVGLLVLVHFAALVK